MTKYTPIMQVIMSMLVFMSPFIVPGQKYIFLSCNSCNSTVYVSSKSGISRYTLELYLLLD